MTSEQKTSLYYLAYKKASDIGIGDDLPPEYINALRPSDVLDLLEKVDKKKNPLLWKTLIDWDGAGDVIHQHDKREATDWMGVGTSGLGLTALGGLVGHSLSGTNDAKGPLVGIGAGAGLAFLAALVGAKLGGKGKPRTRSEQRKVNKSFPFWSHVIPGKGAYEIVKRAQFLDKQGGLFDGFTTQEAKDFYAM